jgi:60 kDa SS-A/Ro ribonucleoprotein
MSNKQMFKSEKGHHVPAADTFNEAGGPAYAFTPEHALAQLACTGCFSNTFYSAAETQLETVVTLANQCSSEYIAQTAIYARQAGFMKDMPAALLVFLSARVRLQAMEVEDLHREYNKASPEKTGAIATKLGVAVRRYNETMLCLERAFPRVIDNGKMLRNFVQIMRSGVMGRKSLGTQPRRLIRKFLTEWHNPTWLFRQSVGQDPSLADIIKMVRPKGLTSEQNAFFGYLIGKVGRDATPVSEPSTGKGPYRENGGVVSTERYEWLPQLVKDFELWKTARAGGMPPDVPFQMLANQPLTSDQWAEIFRNGGWHFTRMNLNTAMRHKVFESHPDLVGVVAERLRDAVAIEKARVFPYQLLTTYLAVYDSNIPREIIDALHDALEVAVSNVPPIEGTVVVFPDVSGSMDAPVTGYRKGSTSTATCEQVAALISAVILRQNREATIVPVDTQVHVGYHAEPRDSVMTNARRMEQFGGGGTDLAAAFRWLNGTSITPDVVFLISDMESWVRPYNGLRGTGVMAEFAKIERRNPRAKLVCIDLQAYGTTQAPETKGSVLNIGGWSDQAFKVVDAFLRGEPQTWVDTIKGVDLQST